MAANSQQANPNTIFGPGAGGRPTASPQGSKRKTGEGSDATANSKEVQDILDMCKSQLESSMGAMQSDLLSKVNTSMAMALGATNKRINGVEGDINDLRGQQAAMAHEHTELAKQMQTLQGRMATTESVPAAQALDQDDYNREIQRNAILIETEASVTQEAIVDAIASWMEDGGYNTGDYNIYGGD